MKRVIKNKKKMKNTMYIVFGTFALLLFMITRTNPSFANEGLIIDEALDKIAEQTIPSDNVSGEDSEVSDESIEGEDPTEPEIVPEEKVAEGDEISQDLENDEDDNGGSEENLDGEEVDNGENDENEDGDKEGKTEERDKTSEIEQGDNQTEVLIPGTPSDEENHGVIDNKPLEESIPNDEQDVNKSNDKDYEGSETGSFIVNPDVEVQNVEIESEGIRGEEIYEGVKVEVYAPEGAFPKGTILSIVSITSNDEIEDIQDVLEEQKNVEKTEKVIAFDITFLDPETQEELQPLTGTVQVIFNYEENEELKAAEENENQEVKVYHLNDKDEEGEKVEEITDVVVEEVIINEEKSEEENVMVVEAESFSVYTIVVQVKEEQLINFEYGMISIANPSNSNQGITIMDRNLGATLTGSRTTASNNSYGYYYQWGNNYGFDSSNNISKSSIKVDVSGLAEYSGSTFVTNSTWMSGTNNDNLWNGESKQGPCPVGWHVPTSSEWSQLYDYYSLTYVNSGVSDFSTYFNLPLAGYLSTYGSSYSKGSYGYYWSSTPYSQGNDNVLNFYLYSYSNTVNKTNSSGRGNGYSVRCFRDSYVGNSYIYTVELNFKGGVGTTSVINVQSGDIFKIPSDPVRDNSIFSGWYLSGTDVEFDFTGTEITKNISLYAKRNCEEGYQIKNDMCIRSPNGKNATLLSGQVFNIVVKKMATPSISSYNTAEKSIKTIKSVSVVPDGLEISSLQKISASDSDYPIYAWYDVSQGIVYYYTEAGTIYMNEDSSFMFRDFESLMSLDLNNFDTSKVTDMSWMFYGCDNLSQINVGNFDTSNVTNMHGMFGWTKATSLDLSSFDTSNVTDMSYMFHYSNLESLELSNFDTSNVTNMEGMFESSEKITSLDLSNFDTSNVTKMNSMFELMRGLISLDLSSFDTKNVTDMHNMFRQCIKLQNLQFGSKFKADKATNMYGMFNSCGATRLDLSSFDTKNATNMGNMFYNCDNLVSLDLSSFDTKNVTDMNCMFESSDSIEEIIFGDNFDTSNVRNMNYMFGYCPNLRTLDLSKFNTSKVTDMGHMFQGDSSLMSLDLSNFDTRNVTAMYGMFEGCRSLTELDISNFDTSKLTSMGNMFSSCNNLRELDLTSFDTSNVTNMDYMFSSQSYYTRNLKTIYVGDNFKTDIVNSSYNMFNYQTSLIGGNGTTYNSSYIDKTYARIDKSGTPGYFTHGIRLNFNSMGGTSVRVQTIKKGLTGSQPDDPIRTGYSFGGWYESGAIQLFDFTGTEVTQDITLYAKWNANTYTVSFNADNDDVNPENMTVTYDSQYPELPVVTKMGYTFNGWYNGEEKISSGDVVQITGDVVLKAKRTINQYKIIFNTDGGSEIDQIIQDYNTDIIVPNNPTKTGYTFNGWNKPIPSKMPAENLIITAQWKVNQYKITFDTDGGNEIGAINLDYSATIPNLQIPIKECNEFSGWDVELPETMPAHDITLKAVWNYTCSRSSGGGGRKSEATTREIAIDTNTENEHNSADEKENTETSEVNKTTLNEETSNQVISVTQEVSEDGTVEAVVETVKIRNTDIIATVRTEVNPSISSNVSSNSAIHTKEQKDAYSFAKSNGITTTKSIETAKMDTELTRIEMAKMVSNYAINVLGQEPDTSKGTVQFKDVTEEMDKQYDNAVTKAYQLGIMGQNVNDNKFRPNDEVSRAEFSATLSRLLYHTEEGKYKGTGKYYVPHVAKLYNEGIINKVNPRMKEKRGYVMTMLMRTVK